ncbi:MAG TPA: hypothetical protein VI796_02605, partial [Candidatus Thermoplasmatota archaeon]|nr:hypothetical protein [Candidatus Thermoplasmatota archaeon]
MRPRLLAPLAAIAVALAILASGVGVVVRLHPDADGAEATPASLERGEKEIPVTEAALPAPRPPESESTEAGSAAAATAAADDGQETAAEIGADPPEAGATRTTTASAPPPLPPSSPAWEPWMDAAFERLRSEPSFLTAAPSQGPEGPRFTAFFSGSAPPELPGLEVPAPWVLEQVGGAAFERLDDTLPNPVGVGPGHNGVVWNEGIGPGSQIFMALDGADSPAFICTANFVWRDQYDRLLLGAAGHCFLPSWATAGDNVPGGNFDLSNVRVWA